MSNQRSALAVIFITVFIYLVGFGVIIPIIPSLAKDFGATSIQVGLLMSGFSAMQFLFAPFWGRRSDRLGRRPILIFCLIGEACSYLLFAFAKSFEMLLFARIIAGFFGASISTASAYISDVTPKNERSKGMALIGAAFGLGFLIGPVIGGGLMIWGQSLSAEPHFGTSFASLWVGGFCLATATFAYFRLPESLPSIANKTAEMAHADLSTKTDASASTSMSTDREATSVFDALLQRFRQMATYGQRPLLGAMIFIFFLNTMAFAQMESTLVLLMKEKFLWTTKDITFGFGYVGLISVFCQGYLVRKLIPIFGERKLLAFGLITLSLSLLGIGFASSIPMLAVVMTTLSIGSSFTNPNILGSVSLLSSSDEQGVVMGTAQGVASLGRILGPVLGGALYQFFPSYAPFVAGFAISFAGFLLVAKLYSRLPESGKKTAHA